MLTRVADGYQRNLKMLNGLPFLSVHEGFETLLSESELRIFHRNLGHPSDSTIRRTLDAANVSEPNNRYELEKVARHCRACQLLSTKPKRFRVSLRDDITGEFNYIIMVDVMYLSEDPVLHCVDVGTGF
jgi:hypothetical protein